MVFDPQRALASEVRVIENALIVPFGAGKKRGMRRPAGVYDAQGTYLPLGQCWRNSTLPTTEPPEGPPPAAEESLPGQWLYGGLLYQHFGHFLLESTGRLWAHDHAEGKVKGELFLLKKQMTWPKRFVRPMRPLLEMFGARHKRAMPVMVPFRVERLLLAPQGFGTGDMIAGCPEYRDFTRRRLSDAVAPEGAEKIYISRTRLFAKRGRYLAEARIEALFEAEGYRIYHPQDEPIAAQIAQYRAARVIVSSDSSALHLAAFFAEPGDRVAIVLRRPGTILNDYLTQYRAFSGVEPDVVDALTGRYYSLEGEESQTSELYSELDLPRLGADLAARGYLRNPQAWGAVPEAELVAERDEIGARLGSRLDLFEAA